MRTWRLAWVIALAGCPGPTTLPADAWGPSSDPLPPGAALVDQATFDGLKANDEYRARTPAQDTADQDQQAAESRDAHAVVDGFVAAHPALADRIDAGVDLTRVELLPSGDLSLRLDPACADAPGHPCPRVTLLGSEARLQIIAAAITRYPTAPNQLGLYTSAWERIAGYNQAHPTAPLRNIGRTLISTLPTPDQVAMMSDAERAAVLAQLSDLPSAISAANTLDVHPPPLAGDPRYHLLRCDLNLGTGTGGDRTGWDGPAAQDACATTFSASGVMANQDFAMKPYLSCVKAQTNRGTCWSFAVASALEAGYAQDHVDAQGVPVYANLSEQWLVGQVKLAWDPNRFDESYWAGKALASLVSRATPMPFESLWDYNGSPSRWFDHQNDSYADSCDGYTEPCSETAHQARLVCADRNHARFCANFLPKNAAGTGVQPLEEHELWDTADPDASTARTVVALMFGEPLVLAIDVMPELTTPTAGWVRPPIPETPLGSHAVHLVGFISNEVIASVPAMAGHLHDATTGGGYFIVKNSWGTCYGDGGYVYVPISYLRDHATSMVAIGKLQK